MEITRGIAEVVAEDLFRTAAPHFLRGDLIRLMRGGGIIESAKMGHGGWSLRKVGV
jgi:hypothetical protein